MSQDQEWLVRLQFLEEAQEYINTIESNLLGLSTQGVSPDGYNDILRAAHSLKGGSALMGFEELSQVAHRLEDFFKVLKAGHRAEVVDASLEQLFFKALDCMGQMGVLYKQQHPITPAWLAAHPKPFLDELYNRLGDPLPEDDIADLSAEAGEDMVSLMFSSEVEPCLDRIEGILADPAMPLLKEEFILACQEMAGLGEMLELPVFAGLCQQVTAALETAEGEGLVAIAQASLEGLQRAQALVLMGESKRLPQQLDLPISSSVPATQLATEADHTASEVVPEPANAELIELQAIVPAPVDCEAVTPEITAAEIAAMKVTADEKIAHESIASEAVVESNQTGSPELSAELASSLANLDLSNLGISNLDNHFGDVSEQPTPEPVTIDPTPQEAADSSELNHSQEPDSPPETFLSELTSSFANFDVSQLDMASLTPTPPAQEEKGEVQSSESVEKFENSEIAPELTSSLENQEVSNFEVSHLDINHLMDSGHLSDFQLDSAELQQLNSLAEDIPAHASSDAITASFQSPDAEPTVDSEAVIDATPLEAETPREQYESLARESAIRLQADADEEQFESTEPEEAIETPILALPELSPQLPSPPELPVELSHPSGLTDSVAGQPEPSPLASSQSELPAQVNTGENTAANFAPASHPIAELTTPAQLNTQSNAAKPSTAEPPSSPTPKVEESTVRVSVNQLERLGELFGELNTRRGGLDLRLSSLKGLMALLNTRVKSLSTANEKLRESYDATATMTASAGAKSGRRSSQSHDPSPSAHAEVNFPSGKTPALNQEFDLLEMDQYSDIHLITQEIIERVVQIQEVSSDIELALGETEGISRELSRTSRQMQVGMTQVRMRPLSELTRKFPRLLRQLSLTHGKLVQFEERGTSTLIERSILEALQDPLMHLLRNCFDHGLEFPDVRESQGKPREGTISISANYRGNQTIITIQDDGQGISLEKIKAKVVSSMGLSRTEVEGCSEQEILDMIFEPGFTTADRVTDLSGRGVGMDVVRSNLTEIQGTIQVETEAGKGTTFTITVPLSISVTRVLVVESQGLVLAFPTSLVEEMLLLESQKIMTAAQQELLEWQGYTVPLLRLNQWLSFNRPPTQQETESRPIIDQAGALLVTHNNSPYAIHCDRYWGEQEVTTRLVEGNIHMPPGFSGCVVLGDGRVAPLVETEALLHWIFEQQHQQAHGSQPQALNPDSEKPSMQAKAASKTDAFTTAFPTFEEKQTVMIVDDSINVRRFLAITLEKAGYRIEQAKDGLDAIEKLQANTHVDIIVSDVEMPRMDGFQFLAEIHDVDTCKSIPVVMLTSRSGAKHRKLAKQLGAADYFSKPFKQNELLNRLAELTQSTTPA